MPPAEEDEDKGRTALQEERDKLEKDLKDTRGPVMKLIFQILKLDKLEDKIKAERARRESPDFIHPRPRVYAFVKTWNFEIGLGCLVCANGVLMGLQTDARNTPIEGRYDLASNFTDILFMVELYLRYLADGWLWFCSAANVFDFCIIVFTGFVPTYVIAPVLGFKSPLISVVQILRFARLIRLVRAVRTKPMFKILWQLLGGMVSCVTTLIWTWVVLGSVIYVAAIFSVQLIGRSETFAEDEKAQEWFGTIQSAAFNLFLLMNLDGWASRIRPLSVKSTGVEAFLLIWVTFGSMVLGNLIIATIINTASQSREEDHEFKAARIEQEEKEERERLGELFQDMDKDEKGFLTREEYKEALEKHHELKLHLQLCGIDMEEAEELWELLNFGEEIDSNEFADGIKKFKEEAKAQPMYIMIQQLKRLEDTMSELSQQVDEYTTKSNMLIQQAVSLNKSLGNTLGEVANFMAHLGPCIPPNPTSSRMVRD